MDSKSESLSKKNSRVIFEFKILNLNASLYYKSLLESDFCSAAILISFGAVIGKTSLTQLVIMATFEVVIQSVNEYIGLKYLKVSPTSLTIKSALILQVWFPIISIEKCYDVGESIYVHVFGAYFGMTVAKILHHKEIDNEKEESNYHSDLFAMIGTLFLYLYWVSHYQEQVINKLEI